ncbi:MAG: ribosome-binding factor A [Legionellales bacterium]|jgi:ribosome-binding factor A|nr:ribosome-binding factor A [Legionellales bacterium]HBH10280.1 30S ribosome-binding factor RbfA [Gammaproteobacteria bacterium]|tara:strand:+ start:988 stop:1359 length:372 start_codon:yes stop_codon:yes gene_type:complete
MPKEFGRNLRVAKLIKEELATLIQEKFPLKQYGLVTLTNVDVSPDLKNSTIYFTSLNNKKANSEITIELNQNAGHFRYEVSKILTSKTVPSLCFKYDQSMERVQRLNTIFELVNTQSEKNRKT